VCGAETAPQYVLDGVPLSDILTGRDRDGYIKSGGGADYHGQCSRRIRRSFCAGLPKSLKSALGCPGLGNYLSKDMKGFAAFWPEAKYGKMRIEGRDPVNA
jgi:hypothetical protein